MVWCVVGFGYGFGVVAVSGFGVRRVGGRVGAEVVGVDISGGLSGEVLEGILEALVEFKVLFFRGQELTDAGQVGFAECFGVVEGHPLMRSVGGGGGVLAVDGLDQRADHWHTDVSFRVAPSLGTTLRSVVLPEFGGDTLVASGELGYRDLPRELRRVADGLWAVHTNHAEQPRLGTARGDRVREEFLSRRFEAVHPVVRVHPVSGEPCLFLGGFAQWFVGMSIRESRGLLDVLQGYVRRPENSVRWSWRPGDVVVFDNRCTQHYAVNDYGSQRRVLHRVSVAGEVPVGVDGGKSYALREGE
ncbi:TauD/TfdA dioxygenase family protein [Streptomyces sp. NPDC057638]|uniref:TauD/TfdA dioxygenase family protein n=1 Tax=Streptomyces sp. NPDC057638 TaxID=3346190 RepID=UPI0036D178DB